MSLILAIEPDRLQASKVTTLAQTLGVELVIGASTEEALAALGTRVPDLVLTSQLLAPKDESVLSERLRALDASGMHAPTLVIPVLGGEEREQKKKGGLFGRLRRSAPEHAAGETEGCDPAVFGKEVKDYLERGAVERAALAAAQADLEAAWAEAAPSASAQVAEPGVATSPAIAESPAIDVHPEMVIEDPHALFGEFAAIPIRRAGTTPLTLSLVEPSIELASAIDESLDDELPPATPPWTPPQAPADEEWEEITLDTDGKGGQRPDSSTAEAVDHEGMSVGHHVDLASESMDLDAFVRELHTVESAANAQPMIPVVDLTHVVGEDDLQDSSRPDAVDAFLPEPVAVTDIELREEARAAFEAEVAAVFTSEAELSARLNASDEGVVAEGLVSIDAMSTLDEAELIFASELETTVATASELAADHGEPAVPVVMREESGPSALATLAPDYLDAALAAFNPEIEAAQRSRARTWEAPAESWRAELDALPPPPAPAMREASAVEQAPQPSAPALGAKWGDVLSSIRRDIDQRRAAEETPAPIVKPKADIVTPPLVFPTRTVAPSVVAAIESGAAERVRPTPLVVTPQPAPDVVRPDRALAALLETVSTAESLRARSAIEKTPTEPPVLTPSAAVLPSPTPIVEATAVEAAQEAPEAVEPAVASEALPPVVTQPAIEDRPSLETIAAAVVAVEPPEVVLAPADAAEPTAPAADPLAWLTAAAAPTAPTAPKGPVAPVEFVPVSTPAQSTGVTKAAAPETSEAPAFVASPVPARPVEPPRLSTVAAAPVVPAGTARSSKSKKKRRHQKTEAPPQVVRQTIGDWGFFDPQAAGFGPLVARLNQLSRGMESFPRG